MVCTHECRKYFYLQLKHWAGELSAEVCERLEQDLEENERRATLLTICYHYYQNKTVISQSRSCTLNSYKPEKMALRCVEIVSKSTQCPVAYLGLSAGKFIQAKGSENFRNFFKSDKLKHYPKTDLQTENKEMEYIPLRSYTADSNATIVTCTDTEMKWVSNDEVKGVAHDPRASIQLNDKAPNTKTDWSPTSRKLNNLIRSLNDRNERKTSSKKKSNSNSHLNDSLDKNEFKQSFFMNVFNSKEIDLHHTSTCGTALAEFDEKENADECDSVIEHTTKIDETEDIEEICVIPESSDKESCLNELDSNMKRCDYKESIRNRIEEGQSCSSADKNKGNESINVQSIVKLQEIFPDLNNIDPSVVALLPSDLQEEAKLHVKAQNKKSNTKETAAKNSRAKSKIKTHVSKGKRNNGIYSFLIKRDVSNFSEVPSKKCPQCHQMIPVVRYDEHCDFHVAENLQRELNNPVLQTAM